MGSAFTPNHQTGSNADCRLSGTKRSGVAKQGRSEGIDEYPTRKHLCVAGPPVPSGIRMEGGGKS
jgi:hypothetical protein